MSKVLKFPETFQFGTSTASYQIETAIGHDWKGIQSRDGHTFDRTTDHELRVSEDVDLIASLAPHYRMSLMWSKLQPYPMASLDVDTVNHYHHLLQSLRDAHVKIMMVLHHFSNPKWFSSTGGWEKTENIRAWVDYCEKVIDEFGHYVYSWNTFNEPNVYLSYGYIIGEFPPYKKNIIKAVKALKNMSYAHELIYDYIKVKFPESQVGISHNSAIFGHENLLGWVPAKISDLWFMEYIPRHFEKVDFFGMSYYAKISHDPFPITFLETPHKIKKLGKLHDDIWEVYPEGMGECIKRYWDYYQKPIIITENGICTQDDQKRIDFLKQYMKILHDQIQSGIDIQGYYYWSPWDNFEWHLGPTFRFGLYECDLDTKDRKKRPSADLFSQLAYSKELKWNNNLHFIDS